MAHRSHRRVPASLGFLIGHLRAPALLVPAVLAASLVVPAVPVAAAEPVRASAVSADGPSRGQQGHVPTVIPAPASLRPIVGQRFVLSPDSDILVAGNDRARRVGEQLARLLRPATGYPLEVETQGTVPTVHGIRLETVPELEGELGAEGYRLTATENSVSIRAATAEGLFRGTQTLRQLLPPTIEADTVQPGPWTVPGVHIVDEPRFTTRGAMLDPARHFLTVDEVKRYIDLIALYKINTLHLHLSDDQGWRIQIDSWPRLASYGGSTEVGGGPGGYYTKQDYADIVSYAAERYITVVPEIDMPGHTNAALASYDELNCDGTATDLYTGTAVGFSSLCLDRPVTYEFVDDVIREIAAMTPGPFIHIGGDEAHVTPHDDYVEFIERVEKIVESHGKRMVGWEEISGADVSPSSVAQYWATKAEARAAARKGLTVVMSPASKIYLDIKYNPDTELGLTWPGYNSVQDAYEWDPATFVDGLPESAIAGVEAPLWGETVGTIDQVEFMAFPRMPGVAERGWSPAEGRSWQEYRERLGAHGARWELMSVNFYRSPQVTWEYPAALSASAPSQVVYDDAGDATVSVQVTNRSTALIRDATVRLATAGAHVSPEVVQLGPLPPGEVRDVRFTVDWPSGGTRFRTDLSVTSTWREDAQPVERTQELPLEVLPYLEVTDVHAPPLLFPGQHTTATITIANRNPTNPADITTTLHAPDDWTTTNTTHTIPPDTTTTITTPLTTPAHHTLTPGPWHPTHLKATAHTTHTHTPIHGTPTTPTRITPHPDTLTLALDSGTTTSPVHTGYQPLGPTTTYTPQRQYGWTTGPVDSRDRHTGDTLRRDFTWSGPNRTPATLRIHTPPGTHHAWLLTGDMNFPSSNTVVTINGQRVAATTTPPAAGHHHWLHFTLNGGTHGTTTDITLTGEDHEKYWRLNALLID